MIHSKNFSDNPALYVFLPVFYMIWADAELTPDEVTAVKKLLNSQKWLKKEEIDFLLSNLNPEQPPTPDELKEWQNEMRKANDQLGSQEQDSLIDIGFKLVTIHQGPLDSLIEARPGLDQIEDTLGIISRESVFNLKFLERTTLTSRQATEQTFDIDLMNDLLDGSQSNIINRIKAVISRKEFTYIDTQNLSEYREQVLKWCRYLAAEGFGAMAYPPEYGGQGDIETYFSVMEALSYHDLSLVIKFGVQFGLFGMSIFFLGTEKHHKKYLKAVGTLDLPGCFAMTETGHGSNVKGIETTATYHHEAKTFTIQTPSRLSRKEYIGNAALHGRMATVFAKLIIDGVDYGVNGFLVPLRDQKGKVLEGVSIKDCGRKMGLNGVDNGIIYFDQVVIPKENMLDRYASISKAGKFESPISSDNRRFFTMLGTLVGGRIGIPRSGNAATKSGLTIAIKYGDQRRQFGPSGAPEVPILNYRTHQRRLMPLLANTYALHFSLQYLTNRFLGRTPDDMQEIEALAAGLKAYATWHTTSALQECRECCGGKGYLSENRIDSLKNDTEIYTTFEGDNTVLMQLVAKSRLTEFKKEFGNMNLFGILNYVAEQAKTSLSELNPLVIRNTEETHLLDPEFHLSSFLFREKDILTSAAKRLKKHLDQGMDSFDAFNQCQFHLVNVGFAYIERIILEQFQNQVNQTTDSGCQTILRRLCNLHALSQIEKNKGWFLEHGYMAGAKTIAIRKRIDQLCWEVRKEAVPLVEAFKIPESCLAAAVIKHN